MVQSLISQDGLARGRLIKQKDGSKKKTNIALAQEKKEARVIRFRHTCIVPTINPWWSCVPISPE